MLENYVLCNYQTHRPCFWTSPKVSVATGTLFHFHAVAESVVQFLFIAPPNKSSWTKKLLNPRQGLLSSHIDLWWCTLFANIITFAFYGILGFFLLLDLQNVTQVKSLQSGYIFLLIYLKIWLLSILIPYDWTRDQTLPSLFIQELFFEATHSILFTLHSIHCMLLSICALN